MKKFLILIITIVTLIFPVVSNADSKFSDGPVVKKANYQLAYLSVGDQTGFVVAQVENNQTINAAALVSVQAWQKFLLSFLVYLGLVFVWIFSPAGMIFVAFSLIKHLIKPRNIQTLSLVFQILSLAVTAGFFGLLILGVLSFDYYYEIYPVLNINLVFGLPVILAGMTVLISSVLVMVLQNKGTNDISEENTAKRDEPVKVDSAAKLCNKIKVNKGVSKSASSEERKLSKPRRIVMLVW